MSEALTFILTGTLAAATPFLLAATGELVAERSGIMNLSLEGMMLAAAICAFIVLDAGAGHNAALAAGVVVGVTLSALFAALVILFRADQVAAGLAVGLTAGGLAGTVGRAYEGRTVAGMADLQLPVLSDLHVVGPLLTQDPVVWLALALAAIVAWVLARTRLGITIRAVGESSAAALKLGIPVGKVQAGCVLFGGAMAGLAGAYASVVYTPLWAEDLIAGRGWIAIALVVFGGGWMGRMLLGTWLFGAMSIAGLAAQAAGAAMPSQLFTALPYLSAIIVLGAISWRGVCKGD